MDDLFGEIDYRSKTDSIVMKLLRSAMDKAHEKVQLKDGPIEFLHERSKFYELAAILVEGGLNIVQEEVDVLGNSRNKILSDLMEIRQWLRGRIEDMKRLITDKDKELTEMLAKESMLERALTSKESELAYLREKLELGRIKGEGFEDFHLNDEEIQEGSTEGDIRELKNSLDLQVWNIKQKLEDESKSLSNDSWRTLSRVPNVGPNDKEACEHSGDMAWDDKFTGTTPQANSPVSEQNILIQRMSSDIDILKKSLDLAFGRMQSFEVLPLENKWRWNIEKDILSILVKGFISNLPRRFELAWKKKKDLSKDNWYEFLHEMRNLCLELTALYNNSESQEKKVSKHDDPSSLPRVRRTTSEPLPDIDYTEQQPEEAPTDGCNYVAKMVKNHESIIQKHSAQWDWLKREVLQRKGSSCGIKAKDARSLERRIEEAVTRLDNLIRRNDRRTDVKGIPPRNDKKKKRITKLDVEIKDDCVLSETIGSLLKEDVYMVFFREMVEEWKMERAAYDIQNIIREEIFHFVIVEAVKDSCLHLPKSQPYNHVKFLERFPSFNKVETDGEESFIQKLDSLLRCLEREEDLVQRANFEIKKHSADHDLVILNCEESDERDAIEWLLVDDESTFSSVSEKLERALQQLFTSKELLVEMENSLGLLPDDLQEGGQIAVNNTTLDKSENNQHIFHDPSDEQVTPLISSGSDFSSILQLQQVFLNFENMVLENLEMNRSRVKELKHQVDALIEPTISIRRKKLLYKKAFIKRCHNLQLAESEVDLLGDQVDALLGLLERIYVDLGRNAAILSRHFEVFDILNLIRTELTKGAACKLKS